ncbi:YtxH domain-containing protein [Pontibacter mangrovi]|uniref:YtxH domain-containing protein n=1 Tax=Pontibacter mangrovi TaxID=2589816 RepID=A0A501W8P4_9BACT|nr:YtxH domain-containing protein [Pontibacter mangrovi]TPE43651.1 YtxH domain-containing protein [Pontibacter mangrovi]
MKDNSGKVLLAMLAGASAGVIAGLLMAPDTGEVTRGSIKKWAGKMSKDLEKNLQDGLEEIKKMSGDTFGKSGQASTGGSNTGSTGNSSSASGNSGSTSTGATSGSSTTSGGNA